MSDVEDIAADPGWYVIQNPRAEPAAVVAGPFAGADAARRTASMLTPTGTIMHTPALVNAVKNEGYEVQWFDDVDRPEALLLADGGVPEDDWIGEECPECGVEIDAGSIRYNGYALEHKNPEVHPQAGHHVISETVTDEGPPRPDDTVELRIRTDRVNLAGIMSTYGMGMKAAKGVGSTLGPGHDVLKAALDGMTDVYPQAEQVQDILRWGDGKAAPSQAVDVDLVELEDEPATDADDGDDGEDSDDPDEDGVEIPITDGGVSTDGGRDQDDAEFFVVDEDRGAVVAGPFDDKEAAAEDARDRSPSHIVATEGALELIELTSSTTIRWENDDVDVVTDGGTDTRASSCAHLCTRRFGRTDATGEAVWEVRCVDCGRTLFMGGGSRA